MRVLAATQADNISIGPLGLKQSLLTFALLNPSNSGQPFHLKRWLATTEEEVPLLYKKYFPKDSSKAQSPALFDFSRAERFETALKR
jgi:hypothetical protein